MVQRVLELQNGRRMFEVVKYNAEYKTLWNEFLDEARTKAVFFSRNFLEYHQDRFKDHSMLVFSKGKLKAILPANISTENIVQTHGGLTFGGLIVNEEESTRNVFHYLVAILKYLSRAGISELQWKQSPSFYSSISQDEIQYAFFLMNAEMYRMDIAYAIDQRVQPPIKYQKRRERAIKKAIKLGVEITESVSFEDFWNKILIPNLQARFDVDPVHSLEEIIMLASKNPGKIKQFEARKDGVIMAGATIFETQDVAHAQYISASIEGRNNGSIDLLFKELIQNFYKEKKVFDFGIVNENNGREINNGLLDWKEGFGARAYAHRFYKIQTKNYEILEKVIE